MNQYSLICKYIKEHPNTWEKDMEEKSIRVSKNGNLCLFKYYINADFYDPLVCEARGIIIDVNTLEVIGIGFNKFFNHHEPYASEIDWNSCKVQDKKDGSICKLFWNPYKNKWQWATNGVIFAEDAEINDLVHKNFLDLIQSSVNYKDIDFSILNKDYTYIFEVVDPIMHPVKYKEVKLFHIGTRSNSTLKEYNVNIGIEKPEEYDLHSLEEVISFVEKLNQEEVTQEGVVVVDKNWNRIKIKNLIYLQLHYLNSGITTNKEKLIELLHTDDIDTEYLIKQFPQYQEVFNFYLNEEARLKEELQEYLNQVKVIYENSSNRKEFALQVKDHKYGKFAFRAVDTNVFNSSILLSELNNSRYCNLLKTYGEE